MEIEFYTSGSGLWWWCLFISDSIQTVQKNRESSVAISKEASQAVSDDRTKCVYMSCEQNAGQDYKVKKGNKYCENVVKFRYWGATIMNQNLYLCRN